MADWGIEFKVRRNGRVIVDLQRSHTSRAERRRMAETAAAPLAAPPVAIPGWWIDTGEPDPDDIGGDHG